MSEKVALEDLLEVYATSKKIAKENILVVKDANTSEQHVGISISHPVDIQSLTKEVQEFLTHAKKNDWSWFNGEEMIRIRYSTSTDHDNDYVEVLELYYPSDEAKKILEELCKQEIEEIESEED